MDKIKKWFVSLSETKVGIAMMALVFIVYPRMRTVAGMEYSVMYAFSNYYSSSVNVLSSRFCK